MLPALLPTSTPPPRASRAPSARRTAARRILPLALAAVATLAGMVAVVGTEQVTDLLSAADGRLLTGAVGVQALALLCFANLYRSTHVVVGGAGSCGSGADTRTLALAAFGLTQALPGGGVAGGALAMRRFQQLGTCGVTAASSVIHIGILSMGGLCLVVTVTIGTTTLTTGQYAAPALTGLALCAGLLAGHSLARRSGVYERAQTLVISRIEGLLARRTDSADNAGSADNIGGSHAPRGAATTSAPLLGFPALLGPFGWSIGKWALDLTVLTLVVRAVGGTASLAAIAAAYAAVNLLNSVPLTPGGLGLVEGGLSASLLAAGLDLGTAATATLAYRAVSYWLPLAASVPAALHHLAAARRPGSVPAPMGLGRSGVGTSDPAATAVCAVV